MIVSYRWWENSHCRFLLQYHLALFVLFYFPFTHPSAMLRACLGKPLPVPLWCVVCVPATQSYSAPRSKQQVIHNTGRIHALFSSPETTTFQLLHPPKSRGAHPHLHFPPLPLLAGSPTLLTSPPSWELLYHPPLPRGPLPPPRPPAGSAWRLLTWTPTWWCLWASTATWRSLRAPWCRPPCSFCRLSTSRRGCRCRRMPGRR